MKVLLLLLLLAAPSLFAALSERAEQSVDDANAKVQADRKERLQRSLQAKPDASFTPASIDSKFGFLSEIKDLTQLTMADTLRIATRYNRDFAAEREQNTAIALSYLQARHLFDPRLSGTLGLLAGHTRESRSLSPTGALSVDLATEFSTHVRLDLNTAGIAQLRPGRDSNSSSALLTVTQPLLRGAGRTVAREPLTQAERNMCDRLRAFELFREDFTIEVISRYYNLVKETHFVANNKLRFEQTDFLYRRAQALFKIGRQSELDVLSAEQERLQAENDFRDAKENHKDSLLTFKTFLGIPDAVALDIRTDELPKLTSVKMNADCAVAVAAENRLDLAVVEDQLADAERGLRIAHNGLLPDLSLQLTGGANAAGSQFGNQVFLNHAAAAGITLQLPLDRLDQKVNYRRAELNLEHSKRTVSLFRDNLAADVRRQLRNLTRIEQSMVIQTKIVATAEKRLANAETLFRKGQRSSRDVTDAQQALLGARNNDVQFLVDHAIADLQLRRALGVLDVQPDGLPVLGNLSELSTPDAVPDEEHIQEKDDAAGRK